MSTLTTSRPRRADRAAIRRPHTATVRKAACTALLSILLLVALYLTAVRTGTGQRFENAVWLGAGRTAAQRPAQAAGALNLIGIGTAIAAVAVVVLVGLLRRRPALALAGAAVILASVATSEYLKTALARPNLVPTWRESAGNSFPSGHTTIATAVMAAVILLAPHRARALAALCTAVPAAGIGVLTIVARWHRPSDTLGADLVVLCYTGLAILILAATGRTRPAERTAPNAVVCGAIAAATAIALGGAVLFAALASYHRSRLAPGYQVSHSALYAGCLLAMAGTGTVVTVLVWLLERLEVTPARP